jgi:hypothetical protein
VDGWTRAYVLPKKQQKTYYFSLIGLKSQKYSKYTMGKLG